MSVVQSTAAVVELVHGVIEFRPSQNGKNVICIHPAGGTAFGYLSFAKAMPEEYGVYGIQAKGVDTDEDFCLMYKPWLTTI